MLNNIIKQIVVMLIAMLVLTSCTASESSQDQYQILDANFIPSTRNGDEIYWLDNDRVIFRGHEGDKPSTLEEQKLVKWEWYEWDTKSNQVKLFRENAYRLCYSDGYIFYGSREHIKDSRNKRKNQDDEIVAIWFEGPVGNEKEYSMTFEDKDAFIGWRKDNLRNPLDCKLAKRPGNMKGRWWVPLIEGHGYLDKGERTSQLRNTPIIFNNKKGQSYPLPEEVTKASTVQFYPHMGSYFIQLSGWPKEWKEKQCIKVWWLEPTGIIHEGCMPTEKWMARGLGQGTPIYPTKKGYFTVYGTEGNKLWGGYLSSHEGIKKILTGLVNNPSVSPNGCRVAVAHTKDWEAVRVGGKGSSTIKIIDLCVK